MRKQEQYPLCSPNDEDETCFSIKSLISLPLKGRLRINESKDSAPHLGVALLYGSHRIEDTYLINFCDAFSSKTIAG